MARTVNTQTRKTGDTLRLSGQLTGSTIPTENAAWAGATAVINIVDERTRAPYRLSAAVDLETVDGARRYAYEGEPPATEDLGTYVYEIEVTFSDGTVTTFPASDDKYRLRIVAELG